MIRWQIPRERIDRADEYLYEHPNFLDPYRLDGDPENDGAWADLSEAERLAIAYALRRRLDDVEEELRGMDA